MEPSNADLVVVGPRMHREGLVHMLSSGSPTTTVEECDSISDVIDRDKEGKDEIVVVVGGKDTGAGAGKCRQDLAELIRHLPNAKVLAVCTKPDPECARRALCMGVTGLIDAAQNGAKVLRASAQHVSTGGRCIPVELIYQPGADQDIDALSGGSVSALLTLKEREVYALICQGMSNKEIAAILNQKQGTTKAHVNKILKKLGVKNRTQAVLAASAV